MWRMNRQKDRLERPLDMLSPLVKNTSFAFEWGDLDPWIHWVTWQDLFRGGQKKIGINLFLPSKIYVSPCSKLQRGKTPTKFSGS